MYFSSLMIKVVLFIVLVVVAACFGQGPAAGADMQIDSATRNAVIAELREDLKANYVFPEVAEKTAGMLEKNRADGKYDAITSGKAFAEALTADLQAATNDRHLRVRFSADALPVRQPQAAPTEAEKIKHRNNVLSINAGFETVERLRGNIGYIKLNGFSDPEIGKETVEAAMNFIANTEALIIDLRQNGGGSPEMVALISSYLFGDKPVHLNSLYWRAGDRTEEFWTKPEVKGRKYGDKPVFVLTAKRTFSAGEEFTYNLKNLKRATIIGETTGGGAHPGGMFRLGDHFSAFISTGRAISPITKTNWEGTGVEPDIKVAKEEAFKTAYVMAIEHLATKPENADFKDAIAELIGEIKKNPAKH